MAKRLVILISGSGSNLQAFIDAIQTGALDAKIACVISNKPGVFGLERASKAGIPTAVLVHQDFASREDYDKALLTEVQKHTPDLVILAGFMRILTPAFVTPLYGKLINIHPSLLPKYPGLHTHQRALEEGVPAADRGEEPGVRADRRAERGLPRRCGAGRRDGRHDRHPGAR